VSEREPRQSSSDFGSLLADRWLQLSPLVDAVLDAPRDRRSSVLTEVSGGDAQLRDEIERLVDECERAVPMLDRPAAEGFSHLLVADPDARSPSWSPDGRRLAFAHEWNGRFAVYLMRADGTHRQLLVDGASAPAWSPDGTSIAYRARCGGVKLVTPDGRDVTPDGRDVTPAAASSCHAIGINGRPVWSPDGTKIAVAGTTTFGTGAPVRGTFVMNADGSGLALVTTKAQGVYMGFDPRPAWRPIPRSR